jgi:ATP-binding cassette subfamily B (MDR/TAP) protein 7
MDAGEKVEETSRRANIHDAAMSLAEGYGTQVGERGLMVSGGETQRLGVARVLLKDPPMFFFDDAVSVLLVFLSCNELKSIGLSWFVHVSFGRAH